MCLTDQSLKSEERIEQTTGVNRIGWYKTIEVKLGPVIPLLWGINVL